MGDRTTRFWVAVLLTVGKTVTLNGDSYVVAGVMPQGFQFPFGSSDMQVWTTDQKTDGATVRGPDSWQSCRVFVRLNKDKSIQDAQEELTANVGNQNSNLRHANAPLQFEIRSYRNSSGNSQLRKGLFALLGASGLLWLMTCVNSTSLFFARTAGRQREIAIRRALGASRWRVVRQLLIEGSFISILASVLGFAVAIGVVELFRTALRTLVQIDVVMLPSVRVFLLLVALTISITIVCSVWPSLAMVDSTIDPRIGEGRCLSRAGRYQDYRRRCLVAAEIAMSLTLIVACGLLLRTIYTLQHTPLGFQADHVIVANLKIPAYRFKGLDMGTQLYQPLLQRVRDLPGVENATLLTEVPLGKTYSISFSFSDRNLHAQLRAVGPEAQSVLGFPMLSGRFFNERDIRTSPFVAVVNRAFAEAYLGNGIDPQRIVGMNIIGDRKGKTARVVGLLGDTRQTAISEPSEPEIQICIPQVTPASRFYEAVEGLSMSVAVRTDQDASTLIPKLTKQIEFANQELGISSVKTMDQIVENSYANRRMAAQLLTLFAGSALLLSIGGLYGLLAYVVTQRTREISIRIAVGASSLDISRLIISEAAWIILTGIAVGIFIISCSSRTLVEFLYGVTPRDPSTMIGATLLVLIGGLAAAYLPIHRAVRIDPARALRVE